MNRLQANRPRPLRTSRHDDNNRPLFFLALATSYSLKHLRLAVTYLVYGGALSLLLIFIIHCAAPARLDPLPWLLHKLGGTDNITAFADAVGLWLLLIILNQLLALRESGGEPEIDTFETHTLACDKLTQTMKSRGARKVDLLQVSGHTVVSLMEAIAHKSPEVTMRVLLMSRSSAAHFDKGANNVVNHNTRIAATLGQLELLINSHHAVNVEIRYYKSPPCVSCVIVDDGIVSIGWYRLLMHGTDGLILRGHNVPAVIVTGNSRQCENLRSFAKEHFESVWATASPNR